MVSLPVLSDDDILAARGPRNDVRTDRPYACFVEQEATPEGTVDDVATVFLTNRECPFRCLMCDLWKNTTKDRVPRGAIGTQIDYALRQLPPTRHIKLYNSGNFFDAQAVPSEDLPAIANRLQGFDTVIVENHPKLCGPACVRFRDLIATQLEVAIGLETVHPEVLPRLNKQMTADDFQRAVEFLVGEGIRVRAFLLLRPPFLSEEEGLEWARRSLHFAFDCGVECCAVIPTRDGNGIMETLKSEGHFSPPSLDSVEQILADGLTMRRGRVFVDLWDAERGITCADCGPKRLERLRTMNLRQRVLPGITCSCHPAS